MRHLVSACCISAAFSVLLTLPKQALAISFETIGAPEPIFASPQQSCEKIDIADTSARAFRDYKNTVHLFATHYVARESTGPNLNSVSHDCAVVYSSEHDAQPGAFDDDNWLNAFFTADGRTVAAIVHSEYHGWTHPGMCTRKGETTESGQCWRNTISFALSQDGGYTFSSPPPPANFVAGMPFPYDPDTVAGAIGYYSPSNIVYYSGYYYMMINAWHNQFMRNGACLMRTRNVFDPHAWRAWGGQDFDVTFVDPYVSTPADSLAAHVCTPVSPGVVESLVYDPVSRQYISTEMPKDSRFGQPGAYARVSSDLIHWSGPVAIVTASALTAYDASGTWQYSYSSILDPTSPDRNFSTVASSPYLYYVRLDLGHHSSLIRTLFRIRIRITP